MSNSEHSADGGRSTAVIILCGIALIVVLGAVAFYGWTTRPVEILRVSGGDIQYCRASGEWGVKGKPIWTNLSPYHVGLGFVGVNRDRAAIYYLPRKNAYHIIGKVRVCYPSGKTAVVADTETKGPGPRQQIPPGKDRWDEMRRCQRMAGG